jgi:hypothetical protein
MARAMKSVSEAKNTTLAKLLAAMLPNPNIPAKNAAIRNVNAKLNMTTSLNVKPPQ